MEDQFSIELFKGKTLSDIFQEIYTNHGNKKNQITDLIGKLTPLVDGIGDATLLVPLIKEYMELGIKNDEQLVKLAQIVQRMDSGKKGGNSEEFFDFSSIQNLISGDNEIKQEMQQINEEQPVKEEVEECQ